MFFLCAHAVGRIKSNYVSLPVVAAICLLLRYELQVFCVQCTLFFRRVHFSSVVWLCRRVLFLRKFWRFVGRWLLVFCFCRRMVGIAVDLESFVVGLSE